ncbi:hypothetical protein I7I50_08641 [Histoplasma capsulatum G186AR]|uniref:Uncharacterized protein n=1 Tax=Ajellomyces capsulatus TaxID=5037 RepID=A0A8H7YU64_AJECA|nr:hypothetical protein I7I52_06156 [Histoplasma capsulatum]QSS73751.1 hypothetical protein I7I50_08641 [Histoplasma capsulatum G186AR]
MHVPFCICITLYFSVVFLVSVSIFFSPWHVWYTMFFFILVSLDKFMSWLGTDAYILDGVFLLVLYLSWCANNAGPTQLPSFVVWFRYLVKHLLYSSLSNPASTSSRQSRTNNFIPPKGAISACGFVFIVPKNSSRVVAT